MTERLSGWQLLAERLSEQIRIGYLKPGERLPTEGALQESSGLSRTTVRAAVAELRRRGQVETIAHVGSFVLGLGGTVSLCPGESATSSTTLIVTGADGSTRTLAAGTRIVVGPLSPPDTVEVGGKDSDVVKHKTRR